MQINKIYDVFIAYHGSHASNGSKEYADKVYHYFTERGLRCFFFPYSGNDAYKANIIDVMRSRLFILVCTNGLVVNENKRIDRSNHYELSTEIDAFYALTQINEARVEDAKVFACGEYHKGDEAFIHELFANRTHRYYKEETGMNDLNGLYEWAKRHIDNSVSWNETQVSSEIKEVFATRGAMAERCHLNDLIAKAKKVKAVGISNSELTTKINPNAVKSCIENGGEFELLFLDPKGQYTPLREQEEGLRQNKIKKITELNLDIALDMKDKLGDKQDNYKMFLYDMQPRMNMIFVDDHLILQYYSNNMPGIENPTFYIERDDISPIFEFCENAYKTIKLNAKEIGMDYEI